MIFINCDRNIPAKNIVNPNINGIYEILKKIDQNQKEALIENDVVSCNSKLITKAFDTVPLIITLECDNKFSGYLGLTRETTIYFRVENLTQELVTLRLLDKNNNRLICTRYLATLRIENIVALQCLDPINCNVNCDKNNII